MIPCVRRDFWNPRGLKNSESGKVVFPSNA
jgi:hypothetical protein